MPEARKTGAANAGIHGDQDCCQARIAKAAHACCPTLPAQLPQNRMQAERMDYGEDLFSSEYQVKMRVLSRAFSINDSWDIPGFGFLFAAPCASSPIGESRATKARRSTVALVLKRWQLQVYFTSLHTASRKPTTKLCAWPSKGGGGGSPARGGGGGPPPPFPKRGDPRPDS